MRGPREDGDIIDPSVGPPTPEEIDSREDLTPVERPRIDIEVPVPTPMPPADEP